jgi:hypothetical protein
MDGECAYVGGGGGGDLFGAGERYLEATEPNFLIAP